MLFRSRFSFAVLAALTVGVASPAHAVTVTIIPCNLLTGVNVTVQECIVNPSFGTYQVNNNSGQTITGFAVSTQFGSSSTTLTKPSGWTASYLSSTDWNSSSTYNPYGSFISVFGSTDTGAFLFTNASAGIATGTSQGGFGFSAPASSEFIAFNANGGVVASSLPLNTTVPEPGTYALMAAGLLGLGAVTRRRRASSAAR